MHQKYLFEAYSDVYEYIIGREKFNLIKLDTENDKIFIDLLYYLNFVGYISLSVRLRKLIFIVKVSDSSKNFTCINLIGVKMELPKLSLIISTMRSFFNFRPAINDFKLFVRLINGFI